MVEYSRIVGLLPQKSAIGRDGLVVFQIEVVVVGYPAIVYIRRRSDGRRNEQAQRKTGTAARDRGLDWHDLFRCALTDGNDLAQAVAR